MITLHWREKVFFPTFSIISGRDTQSSQLSFDTDVPLSDVKSCNPESLREDVASVKKISGFENNVGQYVSRVMETFADVWCWVKAPDPGQPLLTIFICQDGGGRGTSSSEPIENKVSSFVG